jgi:murein DD-endopeptidase MepM/ murein hydrolase activator NlpD
VTVLNADQLTMYAQQAGFSGQALQNIVAIALAESGGDTNAYNGNDPSGGSYGVLQINGVHFGNGTSKSCAQDPACSFKYAYQLSNGGSNLNPWSTFTSGLYRNFIGGLTVSQNWYDYSPIGDFGKQLTGFTYPVQGEDIPMPMDTPVTALFSGKISSQYYDASGGTEIIQASDPAQLKGIPYYYFVHLDNFVNGLSVGNTVVPGQIVGYSGGQNQGGSHPAAPQYSSGPHLEIGLSKSNSIPYTLATITPDLNPDWLLGYAQQNNILTLNTGGKCPQGNEKCTCPSGYSVAKNGLGNPICKNDSFPFDAQSCAECPQSSTDPLTNISNFISSLSKLGEWLSDPVRIIKLLFGILLIGGAIFLIASPQGQIAQGIFKGARKVGVK